MCIFFSFMIDLICKNYSIIIIFKRFDPLFNRINPQSFLKILKKLQVADFDWFLSLETHFNYQWLQNYKFYVEN